MQEFWNAAIEIGAVKAAPRSGNCMFCDKPLTTEDIDHSVCNACWDKTFNHPFKDDGFGYCLECGEENESKLHNVP